MSARSITLVRPPYDLHLRLLRAAPTVSIFTRYTPHRFFRDLRITIQITISNRSDEAGALARAIVGPRDSCRVESNRIESIDRQQSPIPVPQSRENAISAAGPAAVFYRIPCVACIVSRERYSIISPPDTPSFSQKSRIPPRLFRHFSPQRPPACSALSFRIMLLPFRRESSADHSRHLSRAILSYPSLISFLINNSRIFYENYSLKCLSLSQILRKFFTIQSLLLYGDIFFRQMYADSRVFLFYLLILNTIVTDISVIG